MPDKFKSKPKSNSQLSRRTFGIVVGTTAVALLAGLGKVAYDNREELEADSQLISKQFQNLYELRGRSITLDTYLSEIEDVTGSTLLPNSGLVIPAGISVAPDNLIVQGATTSGKFYVGLANESRYRFIEDHHALVINRDIVATEVGNLVTFHELVHFSDELPGGAEYGIDYNEMDPFTSWAVEVNAYELEFKLLYEVYQGSKDIIDGLAEDTINGKLVDDSGRPYDPYSGYLPLKFDNEKTSEIAAQIGITTNTDGEVRQLGNILGHVVAFRAIDKIFTPAESFDRRGSEAGYQIGQYYFSDPLAYKVALLQMVANEDK